MKKPLILSILLTVALSFNMFELVELSTKNRAVCLDGSPSALYLYEPDDPTKAPNKILIMFESAPNGWCFEQDLSSSLNNCLKWANNDFGSSKNYPSDFLTLSGILSASGPGEFSNWYKVLIKSCDGGSFLGNREPISLKTQKIYFRGSKIVEETINYLKGKGWLQNREKVVLAGSFNGGVAALHWSQTFQKETKGQVKIIADSAFYLNDLNYKHNRTTIENRMRSIEKIVLDNIHLPHACGSALQEDRWQCFFLENLVKYTNFSTFFSQSLYDGFHIEQVLGFECAELFTSLSQCNKKDKEIIDQYHANVKINLTAAIASNIKFGGFAISCVVHEMLGGKYTLDTFEVPMSSGNMLYMAIQSWMMGESKVSWIDQVEWPSNTPCAKKIKGSPNLIFS